MRECGSGRAGKATALQAVPDGFESHDPLAGVAQSVERELPKLEVAGSRPATRSVGKREPNGKAPGWRPGTRETAWAFEPPRFRQGPLAQRTERLRPKERVASWNLGAGATRRKYADVAQLVERLSEEQEVAGSIPAVGTMERWQSPADCTGPESRRVMSPASSNLALSAMIPWSSWKGTRPRTWKSGVRVAPGSPRPD